MQIWLAGQQLARTRAHLSRVFSRSISEPERIPAQAQRGEWDCYTYTPTEQKSATTPNPPNTLAVDAMASSRAGSFSFGSLGRVSGAYGLSTIVQ